MTAERWEPVPGHEGLYAVSDQGRVKSLRRTHEVRSSRLPRPFERQLQNRYLKPQPNNGSPVVTLYRDGQRRQVRVARLVEEAFGQRPMQAQAESAVRPTRQGATPDAASVP